MSKVLNKCTVKTENQNSLDDFIRGYMMKCLYFFFHVNVYIVSILSTFHKGLILSILLSSRNVKLPVTDRTKAYRSNCD